MAKDPDKVYIGEKTWELNSTETLKLLRFYHREDSTFLRVSMTQNT